MELSLHGKIVVVTGATSGIGLATAAHLMDMGARVIGIGRSEARCRDAQARLNEAHPAGHIEYCVADLSLQRDVRRLADEIKEKLAGKPLDGLVNNAGTV